MQLNNITKHNYVNVDIFHSLYNLTLCSLTGEPCGRVISGLVHEKAHLCSSVSGTAQISILFPLRMVYDSVRCRPTSATSMAFK